MSRLSGAVLALLLVGGCADSTTEEATASYETPSAPAPPPAPERAAADAAGGGAPVRPASAQLPPALPDSTLGRRLGGLYGPPTAS